MLGGCRLCLAQGVALRANHYVPKAVYRQLRDTSSKRPDPWVISGQASFQTSKQLTAHLLCDGCEGALSANGEDWVLKRFRRLDCSFELAWILCAQKPVAASADNPTKVYTAASIPGMNAAALAYFAASVFWRGAIHPWNDDGTIPVPLGKRYSDEFRRYLRGERPFPENAALVVSVREGGDVSMMTIPPFAGVKAEGVRMYNFLTPGLAFVLAVGQRIRPEMRQYCFVRGAGHPIAATPILEPGIEEIARGMHARNSLRGARRP